MLYDNIYRYETMTTVTKPSKCELHTRHCVSAMKSKKQAGSDKREDKTDRREDIRTNSRTADCDFELRFTYYWNYFPSSVK